MDNRQLDLCNFEQSQKLKKLGFNIPCRTYFFYNIERTLLIGEGDIDNYNSEEWGDYFLRPTIVLAIKWLREEKAIFVYAGLPEFTRSAGLYTDHSYERLTIKVRRDSIEVAESEGLDYLLKAKRND